MIAHAVNRPNLCARMIGNAWDQVLHCNITPHTLSCNPPHSLLLRIVYIDIYLSYTMFD